MGHKVETLVDCGLEMQGKQWKYRVTEGAVQVIVAVSWPQFMVWNDTCSRHGYLRGER